MSATRASSRDQREAALTRTTEAAIARLAEELTRGHTEAFQRLLGFYGRFWTYSVPNCLLIQQQCPQAAFVAGYGRWRQLGYQVAKGERAIWIWCPLRRKEIDAESGEEEQRVVGFRPCPVFADTQLANLADKPLPTLFAPLPDDVEPLYQRTRLRIEAAGIAVEERPLRHGLQGLSQGGTIVVKSNLDSRNRLLVLLHELVHELAHRGDGQRNKSTKQKEFEAEATSYVVASALEVEHPTARDYLLAYQASADGLKAALGTIQALVRSVLRLVTADTLDRFRGLAEVAA